MLRPVHVYGAGALGSALGALLSRRVPVTLLGRGPHVRAIRERGGLQLVGERAGLYRLAATQHSQALAPGALVLLTVKAFDLGQALEDLAPKLDSSHVVVVLQNGLGIRNLAEQILKRRVVRAVTFTAAAIHEPGRVALNAIGKTYFSEQEEVYELWQACAMPAEQVATIETYVWRKLAINAVINPLSALLGVSNGELLPLAAMVRPLVEELVRVAEREGQRLAVEETVAKVLASMRQTSRNTSSMLQDIRAGRRTEVDWINGAIVRKAATHGLEAPLHQQLTALVHFVASRAPRQVPLTSDV